MKKFSSGDVNNKAVNIIFVIFIMYIFLVLGTMFFSSAISDKAFNPIISASLHDNNCENSYPRKSFNPLIPFDFYINWSYFSADYRVSDALYSDNKCLYIIRDILFSYKRSVKISVINNDTDVIAIIETIKR